MTPRRKTGAAATLRAQQAAQDRHRRLEAKRIARIERQVVDNFIGDIATYVGAKVQGVRS
jgi:hypothetical protein